MADEHRCDRDDCVEVATRLCYSGFERLCEPHRGPDPHACPECLAVVERCSCGSGCLTCGLALDVPSDVRVAS